MAGSYLSTFDTQNYNTIKAQLLTYRLDPFIRSKEAQGGAEKGLIFPFARGLRFSALLVYTIRECLSGSDLEVNWGQIIDDDGYACSGECDIIIHKKGHYKRWNGDGGMGHIMDFRFIEKEKAIAVISCKSYLTKTEVEDVYCKSMLNYVKRIWLFAECCGPDSVELIKQESKDIGYENFWHLYTWSRTTDAIVDDVHGWLDFVEKIKALRD
ncbi:MAG: hypothetical protein ABIN01_01370 [Ferruginibacter sp.]